MTDQEKNRTWWMYQDVFYVENEEDKVDLLRTSLVRLQPDLLALKGFFKCHRAYIINTEQIKMIDGNAQGYQLKLNGLN